MTLTSDQCAVIATTIPVLMLAIVVEGRRAGLHRVDRSFSAFMTVLNAGGFLVALIGISHEPGTVVSVLIVLNLLMTFAFLAVTSMYGDRRES